MCGRVDQIGMWLNSEFGTVFTANVSFHEPYIAKPVRKGISLEKYRELKKQYQEDFINGTKVRINIDLKTNDHFVFVINGFEKSQKQLKMMHELNMVKFEQQLKVLDQMQEPKFVISDTIELWIETKRAKLMEVLSRINGILINDEEVRLLCGNSNLIICSNMVLDRGVDFIIVKKGEHGAILSTRENIFPSSAYPLEEVVDPTGAGDSFAGGFMGHIARKGFIDEKTLKEAVIYGNVMGSFAVEDFSVNRLISLTIGDIDERFQKYKKLVEF